jgi:hypothetical protein
LPSQTFHRITNSDEIGAQEWMVEKKGRLPMKKNETAVSRPPPRTDDGGPLVEGTEASVNSSGS